MLMKGNATMGTVSAKLRAAESELLRLQEFAATFAPNPPRSGQR